MPICNGALYRRNSDLKEWVIFNHDPNCNAYKLAPFIREPSSDKRFFDEWIGVREDELISDFEFMRNTDFDWSKYGDNFGYTKAPKIIPISARQFWKNKTTGILYEIFSTDANYYEGFVKGSVSIVDRDRSDALGITPGSDDYVDVITATELYNDYEYVFDNTAPREGIITGLGGWERGDVWKNKNDDTLWQILRCFSTSNDTSDPSKYFDVFMYNTPLNALKYTKRTIEMREFFDQHEVVRKPLEKHDLDTAMRNAHIKTQYMFDKDYYEANMAYRVDLTNMFAYKTNPEICILLKPTDGESLTLGFVGNEPQSFEQTLITFELWCQDAINYKVKIEKASFGDDNKEE